MMRTILLSALIAASLLGAATSAAQSGAALSPIGVIDTEGPALSDLDVQPAVATDLDIVTITFSADDPLGALPEVTVNGLDAHFLSESNGDYTYTHAIAWYQPSGNATVSVTAVDPLGNESTLSSTALLALDMPALPIFWAPLALILMVFGAVLLRRRRSARAGLLLILIGWAPLASAQAGTVSNVTFLQQARDGGGTEIIITYDLDAPDGPCTIDVELSKNGGADKFPYPVRAITGDVINVNTGTGLEIVWDVAADYPDEYIAQAQLRLTPVSAYAPWEDLFPHQEFSNFYFCRDPLQLSWSACYHYSQDIGSGFFPPLSKNAGQLLFDKEDMCGVWDLPFDRYLFCPSRADTAGGDPFEANHHIYLGYLLLNDADVAAFVSAYQDVIDAGGDFTGNLPGVTSYGNSIQRLSQSSAMVLASDIHDPEAYAAAAAQIPIMFDWPDNHKPGWGGNVVYLDRHVEFKSYPGEFPMTEATISALAEITGYEPPTVWDTYDPDGPYADANDPHNFAFECSNHLKQVGLVGAMHAYNAGGPARWWPELAPESGRLMMSEASVYPDYLLDRELLYCPGVPFPETPAYFEDRDYVYLGYALLNEADVTTFASAYAAEIAGAGDFSGDLPGPSSYGSSLLRLYEHMDDDIAPTCEWDDGEIPVMIEWPDNHEGRMGGHVLYLDRHVEWHDYPGEFPMTPVVINTLGALAGRTPKTEWADPEPTYLPENDPYDFKATCLDQCKDVALALKMYSNESAGELFMPLSAEPGRLMFDAGTAYPEFLEVHENLVCPGPAPLTPAPFINDQHYAYLGYALTNDADVAAFAMAYAAEVAGGGDFSGDLPGAVSYGSSILRLREGIGRLMVGDPPPRAEVYEVEKNLPVLIEWPDNHEGASGGHVLYVDGHVEWQDYPGEFPMTEATISTLANLAGHVPTPAYATPDFHEGNDPHKQWLCGENMKGLYWSVRYFTIFHLYSALAAHDELVAPLSSSPGELTFELGHMEPYFADMLARFNCPGSAAAFGPAVQGDQSYVYLGYIILNQMDLEAFAQAYAEVIAEGGNFYDNLPGNVSYGIDARDTLIRMRRDMFRAGITADPDDPDSDPIRQHDVPLLIEWPDNHGTVRGGNVVYADGHVEWIDYPGKFPMTEAAMGLLTNLAGRPPIGEK
jgi:prepilin-type processing-associated H-X9-DG protein